MLPAYRRAFLIQKSAGGGLSYKVKKNVPWHILAPSAVACDKLPHRASAHYWQVVPFNHLSDLVTIYFNKPSIKVSQQQDLLSIFLITEYLNILSLIVKKGLKKSFYIVNENLHNKIKGRIMVGQNMRTNIAKVRITNNVCKYQVY